MSEGQAVKTLVISLKTSTEVLEDFGRAFKAVQTRSLKRTHAEISFDKRKDFDRFVRHLSVLSQILMFKPRSVYELAKITGMDVSNLNKIILFFEEVGAVRIKKSKVAGRSVKTPVVDYDQIRFDLRVA
jgi:predicted transcriptional regulator